MLNPRCFWTGIRDSNVIEIEIPALDRFGRSEGTTTAYVLPEHERELRAFVDRVRRQGGLFLRTMAVLVLMLLASVIMAIVGVSPSGLMTRAIGSVVVLIGVTIILFPFATPETISVFGVRRSIVVARYAGIAIAAVGALMWFIVGTL